MMNKAALEYDLAILGGGIAGLTLALEVSKARPETNILVVERQKHPVPEAAHKVGESSVEIQAYYLRHVLGLGEHLQTQQLLKYGLRFFFSQGENRDITRRVEFGHTVLPPAPVDTYQMDRGRLENELGRQLRQAHIAFWDDTKVQRVELLPKEEFHQVHLHSAEENHTIQARWVVDASGRTMLLQRQLGLAKAVTHRANAAWFRLDYRVDIDQWSQDENWHSRVRQGQRWLSTNHLMGPGYWVWLIPLASGSTSVGIVTDATMHDFAEMNRFERALDWLRRHEPQCAAEIEAHQESLQDFRVMKDYSYICGQVFSDERWCLVGEAGFSLDPLYSPNGDLIAISNGLASDLIIHALNGEDCEERAAIHNRLFDLLANSWLDIYERQYPLMGNAQIMVAKIIWDTAAYWAVPGLLYFHNLYRCIIDRPALILGLARLAALSEHIQSFFRDWLALDKSEHVDAFIGYYDVDFMLRLQLGMTTSLADAALEQQYQRNIRFLEQLAGQLVSVVLDHVAHTLPDPAAQRQIQAWQGDPFLANLLAIYQQDSQTNPLDSSWILLGHQLAFQEKAE
jgi:flavin-dependent dehydrogenase